MANSLKTDSYLAAIVLAYCLERCGGEIAHRRKGKCRVLGARYGVLGAGCQVLGNRKLLTLFALVPNP